MKWYKTSSTVYPESLDTTSSKVYNYVRKNIVETTVTDEISGETITVYEYDELKVLKESWELYLTTEANTANIDYLAMMSDIDLPEEVY